MKFSVSHAKIPPVGLDISDQSLKMVQLEKSSNQIRIKAISQVDMPPGWIENGEIKNKEKTALKIRELLSASAIKKLVSRDVVACLPESKTFIKLIWVSKTSQNTKEIIEKEIQKYIPAPIGEIYYDWQIIKNLGEKYQILIGAAPRYIVDQYIDLLYGAKLCIIALEIESIALCRGLLTEENPLNKKSCINNYAIIDLGANHSSLTVFSHNTILFAIKLPMEGQAITKKIANHLNIDEDKAEIAKIVCGLKKERASGKIKNILEKEINQLIKKIKTTFEFYNSRFRSRGPINKIYLCGGGAYIKNLDKKIEAATKITTRQGNVFANFNGSRTELIRIPTQKYSLDLSSLKQPAKKKKKAARKKHKTISLTQNTALEFNTAIGLALREILKG